MLKTMLERKKKLEFGFILFDLVFFIYAVWIVGPALIVLYLLQEKELETSD